MSETVTAVISPLVSRHCVANLPKATDAQIHDWSKHLHGWKVESDEIWKQFGFKNYYQTMAFVNAVAWIAHGQDHHPDLTVKFNSCVVRYSTHSVGGLSENDFICAAKVDSL